MTRRLTRRDRVLLGRMGRWVATAGWLERARRAYQRGYEHGVNAGADQMLAGIRLALAPPMPHPVPSPIVAKYPCPYCQEPVEIDADERYRLELFRDRNVPRAELWAAHCAGEHGHPFTLAVAPCAECARAPAVRDHDLCCDCQAEVAGVV